MRDDSLAFIMLNAALVNNLILSATLGVCPALGVSEKLGPASRMGVMVAVVMLFTSIVAFEINMLLVALGLEFLRLICYVVVIATALRLAEMACRRHSPALFRSLGVFLPLITTNCAILGLALLQTDKGYNLVQSAAYALGSGAGFALVLIIMAGLREQLTLNNPAALVRSTGLALMLAGILSLAFMGFAGMGI